jgi:hypothetical protein
LRATQCAVEASGVKLKGKRFVEELEQTHTDQAAREGFEAVQA